MTNPLRVLGQLTLVIGRTLRASPAMESREVLRAVSWFGMGSLTLSILVALGTGAIIVLETATYTVRFGARDILGGMASVSIVREFGPLMVALVMAAWIGARNVAELGSMQLGGQLPSLRGLGGDPYAIVVAPRIWGTLIAMVSLAFCADLAAVVGGAIAARFVLGLPLEAFVRSLREWVHLRDVGESVVKTAAFAIAIGLLSARAGLATQGGARAVGRHVAESVVQGITVVLFLDVILTGLIGGKLHG